MNKIMEIEIIKTNEGYSVRFKHKGSWKYVSRYINAELKDISSAYSNCIKCSCREKINLVQAVLGANSSCTSTDIYNANKHLTIEKAVEIKQLLEDLHNQSLEVGTVVLKSKL